MVCILAEERRNRRSRYAAVSSSSLFAEIHSVTGEAIFASVAGEVIARETWTRAAA